MISPGGLLLVVLPPTYLLSQFRFYWWSCKRVHNQTWMWKIFSQCHILSTAGDALRSNGMLAREMHVKLGGWGQRESGVEGLGDASNPPLGGRRELFYPKATWSQLGEGQEWHGLKSIWEWASEPHLFWLVYL